MPDLFNGLKFHNYPTMYVSASYSATRNGGDRDPYVQYTFYYEFTLGSNGLFGKSNSVGFTFGVDGVSTTEYLIGDNYNNVAGSCSLTTYNTSTSGSSYIEVYMWCHQGSFAAPTGTDNNCSASSGGATYFGQSYSPYHGLWSGYVNYPAYNPYVAPSIWLNPYDYTNIGRLGSSSWGVHYSYDAGTSSNVAITLAFFKSDATAWNTLWEPTLRTVNGSNPGVWDYFTLSNSTGGFTNGSAYRMVLVAGGGLALSPDSWNPQNGLLLYTYQEPAIGTTLGITYSKLNANTGNNFQIYKTNNRAWASYENVFTTRYRIKRGSAAYGSWTDIGDITYWSLTSTQLRTLIPSAYDGQTISVEFKRYSSSASWYSSNTAAGTFIVYYRPRIGVTSGNIQYRKNNSSGQTLLKGQTINNDGSYTGIYISWTYDTSVADAGYTQGYRVRLYNSQGTVIKTYYTTSKNYTIPMNDICKLQSSSIDVTPYFANDTTDPANYWCFNGTIDKPLFVQIGSALAAPTIEYPIQNSNWINTAFRVCFKLPADPDKGFEPETYHYDNIELMINNTFTIRLIDSDRTNNWRNNLACTGMF